MVTDLIQINPARLVIAGGRRLDKRTYEGKTLLERIRYNALTKTGNASFRMLRTKDINQLFTTSNINLN